MAIEKFTLGNEIIQIDEVTNFDDFIPYVSIKNSCKGSLIKVKLEEEDACTMSDVQDTKSDHCDIQEPEPVPEPEPAPEPKPNIVCDTETNSENSEKKLWRCIPCNFSSVYKYSLTRHFHTHTDQRNYECYTCGFKFIQKRTLLVHTKIHRRKAHTLEGIESEHLQETTDIENVHTNGR